MEITHKLSFLCYIVTSNYNSNMLMATKLDLNIFLVLCYIHNCHQPIMVDQGLVLVPQMGQ